MNYDIPMGETTVHGVLHFDFQNKVFADEKHVETCMHFP